MWFHQKTPFSGVILFHRGDAREPWLQQGSLRRGWNGTSRHVDDPWKAESAVKALDDLYTT